MIEYLKIWVARGDDQEIEVHGKLPDGSVVRVIFRALSTGQPVPCEVTLSRKVSFTADGKAITPGALSRVPVAPLAAALQTADPFGLSLAGFDDVRGLNPGLHPGRGGRPPLFYATWAARYVKVCEEGSTRPVQELSLQYGLSPSVLRGLLNRARERGFLLGSTHGRPGGRLSQRATEALDAAS